MKDRVFLSSLIMKREEFRIVFMGTPDFAVPSLNALIGAGYSVRSVVTAPDRKSGRGRKYHYSPVKKVALEHGLRILQPEKLRAPTFLTSLEELQAHLFVVVAFRMLPEQVWTMPVSGTFNLHASLLPQYRGAAPINHAIINGETKSGLTTFFIDQHIDTGKIIAQKELMIGANETFGELHDRMMLDGAQLVLETADLIRTGHIKMTSQDQLVKDQQTLKTAPKISREFCRINWNRHMTDIYNFIRGLSPFPGAYTYLERPGEHEYFKILKCTKEEGGHQLDPGELETDNKSFLKVAVMGGYIRITELQQAGKRSMNITDFLNGFKFMEGMRFS